MHKMRPSRAGSAEGRQLLGWGQPHHRPLSTHPTAPLALNKTVQPK